MTFADFLTYVKADFKRTDKDAEILQAYNDTILDICKRAPIGAYKYRSYVPTVIGQYDYNFPYQAGIYSVFVLHPIKIYNSAISGDEGYSLIKLNKEEFDEMFPNQDAVGASTGEPTHYCPYGEQFLVGPVPDKATYMIEADWTKQPADQTSVSTNPPLKDIWREVLKWGTLFRLAVGLGWDQEVAKWLELYEHDSLGIPKLLELEEDREGETVYTIEANDF
jgi:hypothetical protein